MCCALRVGICGSGAMGTLFGTALVKGGCKVEFFDAWPVFLKEMETRSTAILHKPDGDEEVPVSVHAFDETKVDSPFDVIIITVKSPMTKSTIDIAVKKGMVGPDTVVVTLQGGFDNCDVICEVTKNPKNLLYGKTACSCKSFGIMKIENFAFAETTVWPLGTGKDEEPTDRVKSVIAAINKAGLDYRLTSQAIADRWTMLVYYLTNIAVSAIVHLDFQTCWEDEAGRNALIEICKECAAVAKAEGVDTSLFNEEVAIEAVRKLAVEEGPHHMGSMHADMRNKRITEGEATLGAILRFGARHGLNLPATKVVYALIALMERNYEKMV